MLLPITLTMAGGAALINAWLAFRCTQVRLGQKINLGDAGNPLMLARMRAHANFAEFTPIVLILVGLIEYARGPVTWLWLVALVYLAARLLHAFGMDRPAPNPLRMGGIGITMAVTIGLAVFAILLADGLV